jgi:pimeloyl-ACP methyl ester carboxylesterase
VTNRDYSNVPQRDSGVYEFGPFRIEVFQRRLLRDGAVVPLFGKAFDTLVALVESAGVLLAQQALLERVWPNVVVEPNNLQQAVSNVRRALVGAEGVKLETVRGRGYRLLAQVREVSAASHPPANPTNLAPQRVHFCFAHDGARLAYARLGSGPLLVKAANWLSHLELDWHSPLWRHWLQLLSRDRCLVRYDARGNGLSDWQPPTITFEDFVQDLGSVFDAAGIERAPVLGISQGASVAVEYAVRHPERVSALILVGGTARGWRTKDHPRLTERFEALMTLMRQGWGSPHVAFRQIFTSSFLPAGSPEQLQWFNELQRQTASPENAASILSALGDLDVRHAASQVRVPTLVVHSQGDCVVPINDGIQLASLIEGARFVPLESSNHTLLEAEPAWRRFSEELVDFLDDVT